MCFFFCVLPCRRRYARPFWVDVYNFDRKRYTSLPVCEDRGTREERMQKRQKYTEM